MTQWTSAKTRREPTISPGRRVTIGSHSLELRDSEDDLTDNMYGGTTATYDLVLVVSDGAHEPRKRSLTLPGYLRYGTVLRSSSRYFLVVTLQNREYRMAGSNAQHNVVRDFVVGIPALECWVNSQESTSSGWDKVKHTFGTGEWKGYYRDTADMPDTLRDYLSVVAHLARPAPELSSVPFLHSSACADPFIRPGLPDLKEGPQEFFAWLFLAVLWPIVLLIDLLRLAVRPFTWPLQTLAVRRAFAAETAARAQAQAKRDRLSRTVTELRFVEETDEYFPEDHDDRRGESQKPDNAMDGDEA